MHVGTGRSHASTVSIYTRDLTSVNSVNTDNHHIWCTCADLLCVFLSENMLQSAYFYSVPWSTILKQEHTAEEAKGLLPPAGAKHSLPDTALFKASSSWQCASYQACLRTTLRILVLLYFSMSLQILITYSSVTSKNWKKTEHTFKINMQQL